MLWNNSYFEIHVEKANRDAYRFYSRLGYSEDVDEGNRIRIALTDVEVLPHYDSFKRRFERFEERCHAYEEKRNVKVIRISDGDGIFIDGEEISVCRI